MTARYIPLALNEDQCRAVISACTAAITNIERNPDMYDRILAETGKSALDLMGLYVGVAIYVEEKLNA